MTEDANFVMQLRERADVITTKLGGPFDVIDPVTATALRAAASRIQSLESRVGVLEGALEKIANRPTTVSVNPKGLVRFARAALAGDAP